MLNKILEFLKKVKWWIWILVLIGIFILSGYVSSCSYQKKLFNFMLDYFRTDQSKIIKVLEENMESYEKELLRLQNELEFNKKQQELLKKENLKLKEKIDALQHKQESIVVPDDPDAIVDELRKLGIGSANRYRISRNN